MNKLVAGPTIRAAYAFAFGQIGTIIGLTWLPMVLMAVLRFLPYGLGDVDLSPERNPAAAGAAGLRGLLFALAGVLLYAMANVAVTRQALGLRKGPAVVHFALGVAELRVWAATLLLWAILGVLATGCALAMVIAAGAAAAAGGQGAGAAVGAIVLLAGAALLLVALIRLSFLYVPVAVAENRVSFERAWTLTAGNFWRIAAVVFAVTLPVFVVVLAAVAVLMGPELVALASVADKLTPEILSERMQEIVTRHVSTMIGINLIAAPFSQGLTLGAAAEGYRVLKGEGLAGDGGSGLN